MGKQYSKNSEPDRIEWDALSTTEQTSLLKETFYEAIKVLNSETMKKHWKKFIRASTEEAIREDWTEKVHCTSEPKHKRAWKDHHLR